MLKRACFEQFRWVVAALGIGATFGACGDGRRQCPDVSGSWRRTVACSTLSPAETEEWEQSDCHIVRRSVAGQLGTADFDDAGIISMTANDGIVCRGSVKTDLVEVMCPGSAGQTCGPDTCCVVRWER
jgi:hypothetical protein